MCLYPLRVAERGLVEMEDKLGPVPDNEAHIAKIDAVVERGNSKRSGTGQVDCDDLRMFEADVHRVRRGIHVLSQMTSELDSVFLGSLSSGECPI